MGEQLLLFIVQTTEISHNKKQSKVKQEWILTGLGRKYPNSRFNNSKKSQRSCLLCLSEPTKSSFLFNRRFMNSSFGKALVSTAPHYLFTNVSYS